MKKVLSLFLPIWLLCLFCYEAYGQIINTFAGNGVIGYSDGGGVPKAAEFNHPWGLVFDGSGNMYIADHVNSAIRKISSSGVISTYAGTTTCDYSGDGGAATDATMRRPAGITMDAAGNLYIADGMDNRIRKVDASGIITTIAGTGVAGYTGDGGPATIATFNDPTGIALDALGNLYIADSGNNVIRKINSLGIISTFAGTGTRAYTGDGGPATAATFSGPLSVAIDGSGNVFIADYLNNVVRKVDASLIINTFAGNGTAGFSGDGGPATAAQFTSPNSIAFDGYGNTIISDENNNRIRMVSTAGIISTIAGIGYVGYSGDGGQALSAELFRPMGVVTGSNGDIYIGDYINSVVRVIDMVTLHSNLSIDKSRDIPLTIYPIPADNTIQVETGIVLCPGMQLAIQNMLGQQMYITALTGNKMKIDISGLLPGWYFATCYNGGVKISSGRFIKN